MSRCRDFWLFLSHTAPGAGRGNVPLHYSHASYNGFLIVKDSGCAQPQRQVKAMYDYTADEDGELPFQEGDIITVRVC
jgi:hypothetical protein